MFISAPVCVYSGTVRQEFFDPGEYHIVQAFVFRVFFVHHTKKLPVVTEYDEQFLRRKLAGDDTPWGRALGVVWNISWISSRNSGAVATSATFTLRLWGRRLWGIGRRRFVV